MKKYRFCIVCGKRLNGRKKLYCTVRCKNNYRSNGDIVYKPISIAQKASNIVIIEKRRLPNEVQEWYSNKYPKRLYYRDIDRLKSAFTCINKFIKEIKTRGCMVCGYNRSIRGLHFHHVNGKSQTISSLKDWLLVFKEFIEYNIVLICSNCHAEVHEGLLDISHLEPIDIESIILEKACEFGVTG